MKNSGDVMRTLLIVAAMFVGICAHANPVYLCEEGVVGEAQSELYIISRLGLNIERTGRRPIQVAVTQAPVTKLTGETPLYECKQLVGSTITQIKVYPWFAQVIRSKTNAREPFERVQFDLERRIAGGGLAGSEFSSLICANETEFYLISMKQGQLASVSVNGSVIFDRQALVEKSGARLNVIATKDRDVIWANEPKCFKFLESLEFEINQDLMDQNAKAGTLIKNRKLVTNPEENSCKTPLIHPPSIRTSIRCW